MSTTNDVKIYKASDANSQAQRVSVTMTDAALAHIKKKIAERNQGIGIRLGLKKSGCAGYAYTVDYVDSANSDDELFQIDNDVCVVVAKEYISLLKNTEIDYLKKGLNFQFEFRNPNQSSACGCGESFTV